ncbi:unnamed protein product [Candidula unifasciata]|uniref:Uncharacterized protein n=1 Tax=Candidula unifasciata TaxID=100452 RepID=A0A8S3ZCA7_9EUPU|nr:unnamed protein product [Candidula unifasciata]
MAYKNSWTQSIKDKDASELIIQIKARDAEISRLNSRIKKMDLDQKSRSLQLEQKLKKAKDKISSFKQEAQALEKSLKDAEDQNVRLNVVKELDSTVRGSTVNLALKPSDIFIWKKKFADCEAKLAKRNIQLGQLSDDVDKIICRASLALGKADTLLRKMIPETQLQVEYANALGELKCLEAYTKAFISLKLEIMSYDSSVK